MKTELVVCLVIYGFVWIVVMGAALEARKESEDKIFAAATFWPIVLVYLILKALYTGTRKLLES